MARGRRPGGEPAGTAHAALCWSGNASSPPFTPHVVAEQLRKISDMAEVGRLRLHVLPFGIGAHALIESMVTLMRFTDAAPVAYVEGLRTGNLMDDPTLVSSCQSAYDLAMGDAVSHYESLALIRAIAEEHERGQH
ncbi:Scr1 family TA system antitoxin-like transcriptional regulator [Streptomyces malaysiensis]|uniref:Scr1 family TA system antitoxin-like transcriptional regulator n=1 Tax=Streptomyces malaysiensis TaxID=92644 RepID=UPI001F2AFE4A|nr:Scr1 family TA system antitoxin-like transcriptional regulator [Streptomyces sp. SPMA113]